MKYKNKNSLKKYYPRAQLNPVSCASSICCFVDKPKLTRFFLGITLVDLLWYVKGSRLNGSPYSVVSFLSSLACTASGIANTLLFYSTYTKEACGLKVSCETCHRLIVLIYIFSFSFLKKLQGILLT